MDKDLSFGMQVQAKVTEAATTYACGSSTCSTGIHHFPPFHLGHSTACLKVRQPRVCALRSERLSMARQTCCVGVAMDTCQQEEGGSWAKYLTYEEANKRRDILGRAFGFFMSHPLDGSRSHLIGWAGENQHEFFERSFYPGLPSISGRSFFVVYNKSPQIFLQLVKLLVYKKKLRGHGILG